MRLINADALKEAFEEYSYKSPYVARMIDACPTVDHLKQGEWVEEIERNVVTASGREVHLWRCSACGFSWANKHDVMSCYKYCPNCGAKMDREAK